MDLHITDPEFTERFEYFAFTEVIQKEIDARTRYLAVLAALIGCGGIDAYREMLPKALENGIWKNAAVSKLYQRSFFRKEDCAAT